MMVSTGLISPATRLCIRPLLPKAKPRAATLAPSSFLVSLRNNNSNSSSTIQPTCLCQYRYISNSPSTDYQALSIDTKRYLTDRLKLLMSIPKTSSNNTEKPDQLIEAKRNYIMARLNFDTYKLVRSLERQGFTRGQAVAIMRTINVLLVDSTLSIRRQMLSKTELENDSFAYKAALSDLRQDLSLLRQNDTATLRSEAEQILRDVETMNATWVEALNSLKGEISMDMNNRKSETRESAKITDLRIQDVQHKLVIKLAELKTGMEKLKMEITKRIVWVAIASFASLMLIDYAHPPEPEFPVDDVMPVGVANAGAVAIGRNIRSGTGGKAKQVNAQTQVEPVGVNSVGVGTADEANKEKETKSSSFWVWK